MKNLPFLLLAVLSLAPRASADAAPKTDAKALAAAADELIARVDAAAAGLEAAVQKLSSDEDPSGEVKAAQALADELILRVDYAIAHGMLPKGLPHRKVSFGLNLSVVPLRGYPLRAIASQKASVLRTQSNLLNALTGKRDPKEVKRAEQLVADAKYDLSELLRKGREDAARPAAPAAPEVDDATLPAPAAKPRPAALKAPSDRFQALAQQARAGAAKGNLGSLRAGLSLYYGDTEGNYPAHLQVLAPKYVPDMPAIELPGHARTSHVTEIFDAKGDSPEPYLTDSGGWIYFASPRNSKLNGQVFLDCSHVDDKGRPMSGF